MEAFKAWLERGRIEKAFEQTEYSEPSISTCDLRAATQYSSMSGPQFFNYPGFGKVARKEYHYSQAVRVGDYIEISGQGKHVHNQIQFPLLHSST